MKKLISCTLGVVMAVGLTACNNSGTSSTDASAGTIAVIAKANASEYWSRVKEGALAAGEDLGVNVTFNGPDTESEGDKQLNQLETALNANPIGIAFAPQDGAQDGAPRLLEQALSQDIPVVIVDTPLSDTDVDVTATVASDNAGMGAQAAEKLIELTGGKGKVAIVAHGEVGTAAARRDGFRDYIEKNAPDMTVVDVQNGESDPAKSRDKAQGILQANPDLVGFFGTDDDSSIAIADEVASMGMDVKVIGVDSSPDVLTLVEQGEINGIIVQNPYNMGYQSVEILLAASKGEAPAETNVVSESVWVTADNMNDEDVQKVIG